MQLQEIEVPKTILRVLCQPALLQQGVRVPELRQRGAKLEAVGGSTRGDEFQAGRGQGM